MRFIKSRQKKRTQFEFVFLFNTYKVLFLLNYANYAPNVNIPSTTLQQGAVNAL